MNTFTFYEFIIFRCVCVCVCDRKPFVIFTIMVLKSDDGKCIITVAHTLSLNSEGRGSYPKALRCRLAWSIGNWSPFTVCLQGTALARCVQVRSVDEGELVTCAVLRSPFRGEPDPRLQVSLSSPQ